MIWLLLIGAVVLLFVLLWNLKIPKCGNMTLVTGGIKTGKSAMTVRLAYKTWKRNLWKYRLRSAIQLFRPKKKRLVFERPYLYSNIPLRCDYVPLTLDLMHRKERFTYGSVIYVCEASLVASSMDYKDQDMNDDLLLFNKLIGHETKGGSIFYDTQSIYDNHMSVKRALASYFYIHHNVKIPFICLVLYVREMKFSEDNSAINTFDTDIEEDLKRVIVPWSSLKLYDRYCYSIMTDHLPVNAELVVRSKQDRKNKKLDLKARKIISFKGRFAKL